MQAQQQLQCLVELDLRLPTLLMHDRYGNTASSHGFMRIKGKVSRNQIQIVKVHIYIYS